jgi:hypothetical protein
MQIQTQLGNGNWVDKGELSDAVVAKIIAKDGWFARRDKREPMTTREQVEAMLATGKELRYADDWYANVRAVPAPIPATAHKMTHCDCGHECESYLVMSASTGSSCPDCYDRMSD